MRRLAACSSWQPSLRLLNNNRPGAGQIPAATAPPIALSPSASCASGARSFSKGSSGPFSIWTTCPTPTSVSTRSISLVADTIGLFASATDLEKLVLSKPVQTYIPLEDSVLEKLAALPGLEEMRLHQTRLPGNALAPLTKLKHLDLSHNRFFDDRGLRHVGRMSALTTLYLTGTSITDEGLSHLAGLTNLTELALDGTGVSDAGVAHLAGLTKLRRLNLQGSALTDAGLAHLE